MLFFTACQQDDGAKNQGTITTQQATDPAKQVKEATEASNNAALEAERIAEEAKIAEAAKKAEEAKIAEAAKKAEAAKIAEAAKKEKAKKAAAKKEKDRKAAAKKAEAARKAAAAKKKAAQGPKVEWKSKKYEYGRIEEGEKVMHVFSFKNTGNAPLIIEDASATCGCTMPEYPIIPINPGEESEIIVTFDSKGKIGVQNKKVTVRTNSYPKTHYLHINGTVVKY